MYPPVLVQEIDIEVSIELSSYASFADTNTCESKAERSSTLTHLATHAPVPLAQLANPCQWQALRSKAAQELQELYLGHGSSRAELEN